MILPMIYLGTPRSTTDKVGTESTLYNVLISSKYFDDTRGRRCYTSAAIVQKVSCFLVLYVC
jgi:hypothetical protein